MSRVSHAVARFLTAHAGKVMPPVRANWARAMRAEVEGIEDGQDAIDFAIGCLMTSYGQRIAVMGLIPGATRWCLSMAVWLYAALTLVLIGVIWAFKSVNEAFFADAVAADPEFAQVHEMITGIPLWELGPLMLWVVLMLLGGVQLARARPSAFKLLAIAMIGAVVQSLIDLRIPAFRAITFETPISSAIGYILPLAGLAPVWWLNRRDRGLTAARL